MVAILDPTVRPVDLMAMAEPGCAVLVSAELPTITPELLTALRGLDPSIEIDRRKNCLFIRFDPELNWESRLRASVFKVLWPSSSCNGLEASIMSNNHLFTVVIESTRAVRLTRYGYRGTVAYSTEVTDLIVRRLSRHNEISSCCITESVDASNRFRSQALELHLQSPWSWADPAIRELVRHAIEKSVCHPVTFDGVLL